MGKPVAGARVALVVFSWTGNRGGAGSAHSFSKWPAMLQAAGAAFDVFEVNLPGRGARMKEACSTDARAIGAAAAAAIAGAVRTAVLLFGFAFGGILAYETAAALAAEHGVDPYGLVVASAEHPGWEGRTAAAPTEAMGDAAFEALLRRKGGTDVILSNAAMKKMYVPVIKSDMILEERYGASAGGGPGLGCPILAFVGERSGAATARECAPWLSRTTVADVELSRVVPLSSGLRPTAQSPWLSDWYLCQGQESVEAMVAGIASTFGGPSS